MFPQRVAAQSGSRRYFLSLLTYVEHGLTCAIVDPITAASYQKCNSTGAMCSKPIEPNTIF